MFQIEGELIDVGTKWGGDTCFEISFSPDGTENRYTAIFQCSKEEAKELALHLYRPVVVTVSLKAVDTDGG